MKIEPEDAALLSPLVFIHIDLLGPVGMPSRFHKRSAAVKLRLLRSPDGAVEDVVRAPMDLFYVL